METEFIPFESVPADAYVTAEQVRPFALRVIAAKLWSEALNTPGSNGETDPYRLGMQTFLLDKLQEVGEKHVNDDVRSRFARSLIDNGAKALKYEDTWHKGPDKKYNYSVIDGPSVDYNPNVELVGIAQAAGIDVRNIVWPMKSHSAIERVSVRATFGYRAPSSYYYPLKCGRVLVSGQNFYDESFVEWLGEIAQERAVPSCAWAAWNWKDYARSLGYSDEEVVASPPPSE